LHGHAPVDACFFLWDLFNLAGAPTLDSFLLTVATGDGEFDDECSVEDDITIFQSFTGDAETSALPI